jgi:A-macroglobulin TED domain
MQLTQLVHNELTVSLSKCDVQFSLNRLSAFVIKCFHEARQFIAVDDNKIAVTLDWLLSGQYRNGSFFEPPGGRVIHTDMQVINCY